MSEKKVSTSKAAMPQQAVAQPVAAPAAPVARAKKQNGERWLMQSIYWVLIAAFVAGGCYMLAKNGLWHKALDADDGVSSAISGGDNVRVIDSDAPIQAQLPVAGGMDEYAESGQKKLLAGDYVGALNDFTLAIEQNPTALGYIFRGEVLMGGANFNAAIADFDAALRMNPTAVVAYYDRALANIKLERLNDAEIDLTRALSAFSQTSDSPIISAHDIYAKRAQVNLWQRSWSAAENDYTSAISQTDGDLDWTDYTGRAEARTNGGDYANAIQDYVAAVTIISDKIQKTPDEKTRENMSRQAMGYFEKSGALRVKLGDVEMAVQDLQAAHTLAIALGDDENKNRLEILIANLQ